MRGLLAALVVGGVVPQVSAYSDLHDCLIEPHMLINVGSPVWGIIDRITVDRGDRISKGQVLAVLDNRIEKVSVDLAKTRADYLRVQYQRLKSLAAKNLVSAEDIDQAATEMNLAEIELERNTLLLDQKTITSPVDGVVLERLLSPGEYAYEQAAVMTVAQTTRLNVEVLVPVSYYGKVTEGMTAEVFPEQPLGGNYIAEVEIIDKVIDAASSTFGIRLNLDNAEQNIPAGLKCSLRFQEEALSAL